MYYYREKKKQSKKLWFAVGIFLLSFPFYIKWVLEEEVIETPLSFQKEEITMEFNAVTTHTFERFARATTLGQYMNQVIVHGSEARIDFYPSYDAYKKANPDTKIKKKTYLRYFQSEAHIQQLLVNEGVRMLRQFHGLQKITLRLPFKGEMYGIELDRKEVNAYLGFSVEKLNPSDASWDEKFVEDYIYNEKNLQDFYKKFALDL